MRVRKKSWTQRELESNGKIILRPEEYKGKWGGYFGNDDPIHVEIGCGKGRFIIETARASWANGPAANYVALEREEHVIVTGARAARGLDLPLAFALGDARDIGLFFEPGEIKRLYINFCDPWPNKKKWAKRRLTHWSFLDLYRGIFGGGGEIFFKTDNRQLFEFSLNQFCERGWRLRNITLDLHNSGFIGNVMTEYEEKFAGQGMPIYRLEASIGGG